MYMGLRPIPHLRNFFVKKFLKNLQKTLGGQSVTLPFNQQYIGAKKAKLFGSSEELLFMSTALHSCVLQGAVFVGRRWHK